MFCFLVQVWWLFWPQNQDYSCCFALHFGGLRCLQVPYLVVVFVQIKRRLQAKLFALDFVQIGSTLAAYFGVAFFLILALFLRCLGEPKVFNPIS